jgi:hypothetical protein
MTHGEVQDLINQAGLRIVQMIPLASLPVSEKHPLLPVPVVEPVERVFSRVSALSGVAQHVIYVCAKSS